MLYEVVSNLNAMMSDFGTVVISAVAFWLGYVVLSLLRAPKAASARLQRPAHVVRQFGMPPSRRGR